jgi:uncharacterized protein (DUF779 family)
MRRYLLIVAAMMVFSCTVHAQAPQTKLCTQNASGTCTDVSTTNPLPSNTTQIGGSTFTLGQKTKANSVPVTIASDQYADACASGVARSSATISVVTATTTSLVAVSGTTAVYVCGFSITIAPSATSADTAQFEYGTGAACTSPTALTGTYGNGDLTTAAPVVSVSYGGGRATIFTAPASNGICIVTGGTTVNVQGVLTYVQQ